MVVLHLQGNDMEDEGNPPINGPYQCKSRGGEGGCAGQGRGFDARDYPPCRAFDRAKRPRGRDI